VEVSIITGDLASTAASTIALKVSKVPAFKAGIAKPSRFAFSNQSLAVIVNLQLSYF
jgi:hypothetical protein